jgi:hypothetical protein
MRGAQHQSRNCRGLHCIFSFVFTLMAGSASRAHESSHPSARLSPSHEANSVATTCLPRKICVCTTCREVTAVAAPLWTRLGAAATTDKKIKPSRLRTPKDLAATLIASNSDHYFLGPTFRGGSVKSQRVGLNLPSSLRLRAS